MLLPRGAGGAGFAVELNLGSPGSGRFERPEYLLCMPLSGQHSKEYRLAQEPPVRARLRQGDIQILPPSYPMQIRWQKGDFAALRLSESFVETATDDLTHVSRGALAPQLRLRDPMIERLISLLAEQLMQERSAFSLYQESLATVLAVRMLEIGSGRAGDSAMKAGLPREAALLVYEYIEANIDRRLALAELAGLLGMGSFRFARAFRESTGMPPHRYVMQRRIETAKVLLSATDRTITDIAYAVGFSSHAHFSSAFKAALGQSPSAFRRKR